MRLQKYIAHAGITSRRNAEEWIKAGKVKVNGELITEMGFEVDPSHDRVFINNEEIKLEAKKIYIMLNKPEGYVTTLSDEFDRPTVADLVKDIEERVYPVGRLDYDSSGLLIMTNDGELTYKLTHPKHEIQKTYLAWIEGRPTEKEINLFKKGVDIGGYITAKAHIEILQVLGDKCLAKVIIHEGKNRQIRRMFERIGHPVLQLKRVAMGKINMNKLPRGKWVHLTEEQVQYLKRL
ncbi:MAG: pseudouridine synthase [Bacillota bacterium]